MKFIGIVVLFAGMSSLAMAGTSTVPEISAASGVAALTLASGALLVIRSRRRK